MRLQSTLAAVLMLSASRLDAEVEVRQSGDRVSLKAVSAPVAEILDRLARQTGMKLVYEAQLPRQMITTTFEQRTPAEAVLGILEGLGLNYALVMDAAGARVDQLLILGTIGVAAPAPIRPGAAVQPARRAAPVDVEAEEALVEEPADEEEEAGVVPETSAQPGPARLPGPIPPEYPSSTFTPKLPPPPTPAPATTVPPAGGLVPPQPTPSPNPQQQ